MINEIVLTKAFAQYMGNGKSRFLEELPRKEWLLALQCPFTQAVCRSFPQDKGDLGNTGKFPVRHVVVSLKTRTVSSA